MEYMPTGAPPPPGMPMPPGAPPPALFFGVAVEIRIGRFPQYTPCISDKARCWSPSSEKRTKPYPRDIPLIGSVMILADLQVGKRFWNRETRTYSLTSGPRSPTKIEYSGPRSSRLHSVSITKSDNSGIAERQGTSCQPNHRRKPSST